MAALRALGLLEGCDNLAVQLGSFFYALSYLAEWFLFQLLCLANTSRAVLQFFSLQEVLLGHGMI